MSATLHGNVISSKNNTFTADIGVMPRGCKVPKRPHRPHPQATKREPFARRAFGKKGPNHDDPKTVLDSPKGGSARYPLTPRGAFGHPKTTKNGTKIDSKTRTKFKSEKVASQERLGCPRGILLIFYCLFFPKALRAKGSRLVDPGGVGVGVAGCPGASAPMQRGAHFFYKK